MDKKNARKKFVQQENNQKFIVLLEFGSGAIRRIVILSNLEYLEYRIILYQDKFIN